jgi:hypothetical protein
MPYQRYLVQNGRVNIIGGVCKPHYGSVVSSSKSKEVEKEPVKEVVGGSLGNEQELARRLTALNLIKKPSNDLHSRLMAVNPDPKKKLINFTI